MFPQFAGPKMRVQGVGRVALGLSGAPVHEPVHAEALLSAHPVTVRNAVAGALPVPGSGPGSHGPMV